MTILIAGASPDGSNIGSHLARHYAANHRVLTVSRSDAAANHGMTHFACDISDAAALQGLASHLKTEGHALTSIINTVGLLHGQDVRPEKALSQIKLPQMNAVFMANAFAPIMLVQALLPLLRKDVPTCIASLSARVGSIADNRLGGWYSYRAAKAAQNQLFKTLAIELQRSHPHTRCLQLHPGTVDTALSKPFQSNVASEKLFTPEFSALSLAKVIASKTVADTGTFWDWNGQSVPW
jgi:NAD(P)-dependent dehydrogenase (short-subunit alcohol dehydrogenase family)